MAGRLLVAVVDDDESVRESLPDLLHELGFAALVFASAEAFLDSGCAGQVHCLLLDITMPGMSGMAMQRELLRRRQALPIVFITAHAEDTLYRRMHDCGAFQYLVKPFSDTALIDAIRSAVRTTSQTTSRTSGRATAGAAGAGPEDL